MGTKTGKGFYGTDAKKIGQFSGIIERNTVILKINVSICPLICETLSHKLDLLALCQSLRDAFVQS